MIVFKTYIEHSTSYLTNSVNFQWIEDYTTALTHILARYQTLNSYLNKNT